MQRPQEQEFQQILYKYYGLRMQHEKSMNMVGQISNLLEGLSISKSVIEELNKLEGDQEIMLPIGNFAYIKAKIPDPDNFLVSVGRKTLVERNSKQALDHIRKKQDELQKQLDIEKKTLEQTTTDLRKIEPIVQQFQRQGYNTGLPPK